MISKSCRIKLFIAIRDIPYRLSDGRHNCSCSAKTKILGEIFMRLGLNCRVAKCKFKWEKLRMPKSLLNLRRKLGEEMISEHTFLRVFIPESKQWITVDPTWDKELSSVFPVADWDGLTDTILAVKTNHFTEPKNKRGKFLTPLEIQFIGIDENNLFVKKFNSWLETIRKHNGKRNT